ncbi:MAG: hypothetical protein ACMXYM_00725 [Candidatus Woesearchaeota archaeon]
MERTIIILSIVLLAIASAAATPVRESAVKSCLGPGTLYMYETSDPYNTGSSSARQLLSLRFYVQFKRDELASEAHTPLAVIAHIHQPYY